MKPVAVAGLAVAAAIFAVGWMSHKDNENRDALAERARIAQWSEAQQASQDQQAATAAQQTQAAQAFKANQDREFGIK